MEATVVQLQRAMDELEAVANYFEALGMSTQSDQLDHASSIAMGVQELLECLLGRVELNEGPVALETPKSKPKKKTTKAKPLGKAHLVKGKAA
jgi:hypothetical protein